MAIHKQIVKQLLLLATLIMIVGSGVAFASTAQSVTQGYQTDQNLQDGMIVRLKPSDPTKVEALDEKNIKDMLGIVVAPSDTAVTLSNVGTSLQVFVATYGQYNMLVSTQNGQIRQGDPLTISSLTGIGMEAQTSQSLVIGKALKDFAGTTDTVATADLTTSKGTKRVSIGRIPVDIAIGRNPLFVKKNTAGVPNFLFSAAQIVTDNPVSAFRIYAAMAVLAMSLVMAGTILFVGINSGVRAIGRNPLAKHSIFRSLFQVTIMSVIVFLIGVFAVYLLLKV